MAALILVCGTLGDDMKARVRALAHTCASAVEAMDEIQVSEVRSLEITKRGRDAMAELICAWLESEGSC